MQSDVGGSRSPSIGDMSCTVIGNSKLSGLPRLLRNVREESTHGSIKSKSFILQLRTLELKLVLHSFMSLICAFLNTQKHTQDANFQHIWIPIYMCIFTKAHTHTSMHTSTHILHKYINSYIFGISKFSISTLYKLERSYPIFKFHHVLCYIYPTLLSFP